MYAQFLIHISIAKSAYNNRESTIFYYNSITLSASYGHVTVWESGNVCCVAAVVFFSLGVLKYVVCLCKGCDECCVFGLYCEAWSCRCSCMGSMIVSSCRCCRFVSCVHPVAVLIAA